MGPGNGLMIEIWLSLGSGKPSQRCWKSLQRLDGGKAGEIGKSHAHVVRVMKRPTRSSALLELFDYFLVAHAVAFHFSLSLPGAAFFPPRRLISVRRWLALESRSRP